MYILERNKDKYLFEKDLEQIYNQLCDCGFDATKEVELNESEERFILKLLSAHPDSELNSKELCEEIGRLVSKVSPGFFETLRSIMKVDSKRQGLEDGERRKVPSSVSKSERQIELDNMYEEEANKYPKPESIQLSTDIQEGKRKEEVTYVIYDEYSQSPILSSYVFDYGGYDLEFVGEVKLGYDNVEKLMQDMCVKSVSFKELQEVCDRLNNVASCKDVTELAENYLKQNYIFTKAVNDTINASDILNSVNQYLRTKGDKLSSKGLNKILLSMGLKKQRKSDGMYYYGIVERPKIVDKTDQLAAFDSHFESTRDVPFEQAKEWIKQGPKCEEVEEKTLEELVKEREEQDLTLPDKLYIAGHTESTLSTFVPSC
jgi:hypothetical protein